MKSPAWQGDHPQTAGEYYSSGTYHGSWDIGMPSGTPIYAPVAGKVLDANTGVPNIPGGSGSPSNWLTLGWDDPQRGKVCLYFQHLASAKAGLKGQQVKAGTLLGKSGNSGNSSGPHLHLTYQPGWRYEWDRYAYLDNESGIYPPSKAWEDEPVTEQEIEKIAKAVWSHLIDPEGDGKGQEVAARALLRQARNSAQDAPKRVWDHVGNDGVSAWQRISETWRKVTGA